MSDITKIVQTIENGEYDDTFKKLYGAKEEVCKKQRLRYINAINNFCKIYPNSKDIEIYSAPGRTEIGGNHTDHNNGIVMAAAVNLDVIAIVSKNNDNIIRVKSEGFNRSDNIDITNLKPTKEEHGHSGALIRGICADIVNRGGKIGGFNAYTTSDVLRGCNRCNIKRRIQ